MDPEAILRAMQSVGQGLGVFDSVLTHEPKSAPALSAPVLAIWAGVVTPIQSSGLSSVSLRFMVQGRVFMNGFAEPADNIDPEVVLTTSRYIGALAGQFSLGGLIRCIDFFGSDGEPLKAESGYLEMDKKIYRCMELEIPLLINDAWELVP